MAHGTPRHTRALATATKRENIVRRHRDLCEMSLLNGHAVIIRTLTQSVIMGHFCRRMGQMLAAPLPSEASTSSSLSAPLIALKLIQSVGGVT